MSVRSDCICAVIQLARQVNALWLLPIAFYELATRENEAIQFALQCNTFNNHPAKLSGDDQILFLTSSILFTHLGNAVVKFLHSAGNSATCFTSTECTAARLRAIAQVHDYLASIHGPIPLELCDSAGIWPDLWDNCCHKCYGSLKAAHVVARQEIWNELPGVCGLPPWPELEKMKADDLKA